MRRGTSVLAESTAYFDVDGTLVGTNLIHPTVMYFANQSNPIQSALKLGGALLQAPAMVWAETRDRRLFNEMLFAHYKGMTEDRIAVLSEEVFHEVVKPRIFCGAQQLVAQCKKEMKEGRATGKLLRPVVAGPEKAGLIVADARSHGHDLSNCSAYSDSYSDVPMLSVVGHPACINPDGRLSRLARAYDWPILDIDSPPRGTMEKRK